MSELSQKLLARSKYYHSKNKDKNRFKKKSKYVKSNQNDSTNEPDNEEVLVEELETDIDKSSRFRRRIIETNVHRYEKPDENVEEDDLSEMISLQESSHAAQFRFLNEKEWDEDQTQGKSSAETEDIKSHFTAKTDPNFNEFVMSHVPASQEDKQGTFPSQTNTIITDKTLEDDQKALESLLHLSKQQLSPSSKGQEDLEQWLESVI